MNTWPEARSQRIASSPPSMATVTSGPVRPVQWAATAAAEAPVPQARVTPAPRSQTRIRIRSGPSTSTNSTLVRRGNQGWRSIRGPISSTG